jgi:hypothetical protein
MAKKKPGKTEGKAAARAAKTAKIAKKIERKEKKKAANSKDYEEDGDLEAILDKVCVYLTSGRGYLTVKVVDAKRLGR